MTKRGWITTWLLGSALFASQLQAANDVQSSDDEKPTASVQTASIRSGDISETLIIYGSVQPQPGALTIISQPSEVRIAHLDVVAGQRITKQSALLEVEASPDVKLQWQDAQGKLQGAKIDLNNTQQRFKLKLATNVELLQAQQAVKSAQLMFDSLQQRGAGEGVHSLFAPEDALVSKVDPQEGQIAPVGTALVELVADEKIGVLLGAPAEALTQLHMNQSVQLFLTNRTSSISGQIKMIGQRVNPDTQLVNVFVEPAGRAPLLINSFVRAEIALHSERALLVPRSAVLPGDQGDVLFTIEDGHAVKHSVQVGIENETDAAVAGQGIKAGDTVVTLGNLELDDGMAVAAEESK